MMGLAWAGSAVAGLAGGVAIWELLARPVRLRFRPDAPLRPPRRHGDVSVHWIALSGLPLTPARLTVLTWVVASGVGILALLVLRSPLAAVAFGYLASGLPDAYVRRRAQRRWGNLDRTALAATSALTHWLEQGAPVLDSLRRLAERTDEPFRSWLADCLRAEAGQADEQCERAEEVLRRRARGIRHIELMLLADLLAVERRRGSAAESLDELLEQWMLRLRADAQRRGTISGGVMLARHMVTACAALLFLLGLTHVAVVSSVVGIVVYGVGVGFVGLAVWVQRGVLRRSEAI